MTITDIKNFYYAENAGAAAEIKDTPPLLIDGIEYLPFQIQISYNNLEGARYNKVITHVKPVTKDKEVAEAGNTPVSLYVCIQLPDAKN